MKARSDLNLSSNACPEVWETFAKFFACYIDHFPVSRDHERIHCAGVGSMDYNLSLQTELPCHEEQKINKLKLAALLSSLDHGSNTIIDSKSGNYNHDDAITSFVLQAAIDCYNVIRILSIDIFVLVDWMFKAKMKTVIQMKNLEGKALLINATYRAWPKVSQTSGHAFLTG